MKVSEPGDKGLQERISPSAWKTLVILSLIATMVMYAETMLIPAIPDLIKDFHISYGMSSWILTAYLIAGAIMTPISGKLSDIYGRKKMLLIVMGIYAIGVSLGGFATDIYQMLAIRIIQGIGMSMFPIAFAIIRELFPRSKIAIGQGVITSMFAAGAVIGLVAGGHLIQNFGWNATFFSIIPVAIALLVIIARFIHVDESHLLANTGQGKTNAKNKIDVQGAITLTVSISAFLMALTMVENGDGANAFSVIGLAIIGIVYMVLFAIIEKRSNSPLVSMKVLANKIILPSNILIMIVGLSMFMVFQTIPVLVRSPSPLGFGEDPLMTSNVQLPFALVLLIFGPTSGFIIAKLGSTKPIIVGSIISTIGFADLYLNHSTELLVSINLAILSTGLSLTNVGAMNVIMLSTPKQDIGVSLGMSTLIRIVGASIGPAMAAMYMQTHKTSLPGVAGAFPTADSYNLIFLTATLISCVSIGLALVLRRQLGKAPVTN
ncbi:Transporter, major facilitator family protein [Nitrosotalea devaniterrae]|uniref:Transporter, major facilitator family protein n=1 Tax=Nitrosotalea devaniterrae TaxID=1078905 RepID=A0A128A240_9ARCH|nr:Transporter, major facilitator family protein [Candidatus Nitrosotalea devanaterra]